MTEPDENADFLLLLYGTLMAAVLAGGIAAVATQDPRFAKIVANAVGVLLLAVWLVLPTRAFQPLAAGYTAVVTLVFALVGFVLLHLPGIYAYMLSKRLVESVPRSIQMGALLLWLLALGAVSLLLYSRGLRRRAAPGSNGRAGIGFTSTRRAGCRSGGASRCTSTSSSSRWAASRRSPFSCTRPAHRCFSPARTRR